MAFQRLFGPGIALAEIAILEGRLAEGLANIERVVDAGWVAGWRLEIERNPILDAAREEPAYRRIVQKLEASIRRHRERFARSGSGT